MRAETDRGKLEVFFEALGNRVSGEGRVYLTGGATAVLYGWRSMTIDVDIKGAPEPNGFFEAIAALKDELDINIELASPDLFIPALPDWRERSLFIGRHGHVEFFHYDPYSQALAKIERGHGRDAGDVRALLDLGLIDRSRLLEYFLAIEKELIRYPAIDPGTFRGAVAAFCVS
ncbi:MAG: hypothetical protein WC076_08715 [Terrimicrobiaceae bacterium]|jgi:hypothetical protein|nr:hypothetical protein [Terrimicrobiaceae bacterium]